MPVFELGHESSAFGLKAELLLTPLTILLLRHPGLD